MRAHASQKLIRQACWYAAAAIIGMVTGGRVSAVVTARSVCATVAHDALPCFGALQRLLPCRIVLADSQSVDAERSPPDLQPPCGRWIPSVRIACGKIANERK